MNCNRETKCDKRECEYPEVINFIRLLNDDLDKNYEWKCCPDAERKAYLADLEFYDKSTDSTLYIEVKKADLGYCSEKNKEKCQKGEENGQLEYRSWVDAVIRQLPVEQQMELEEFAVIIPAEQYSKDDREPFCRQLYAAMSEIDWATESSYTFVFKRKGNREKELKIENQDCYAFL